MKENDRLNEAVDRAVRRASQKELPVVPPPASRWDVWKSTATTIAAILVVFTAAWGGYTNIITRAEAAGASKAVDAGAKVERIAADLEAHKIEEARRLQSIEAKQDEAARKSEQRFYELYQAVMFSRRTFELEAPPKDAGK